MYTNSYRHREFAEWCRSDGKRKKTYGNLQMVDNEVYSYSMLIGKVDRAAQVVLYNKTAEGRSRTTTVHLESVKRAAFFLQDWYFAPVHNLYPSDSPTKILQVIFPNMELEDWPVVRDFRSFLFTKSRSMTAQGLTTAEIHVAVDDYIAANRKQRAAMRGGYELRFENI